MVGSPELAAPGPAGAGSAAESASDIVPRAEAPSARGNMVEYEQSGRRYRVLETSYGYDERGLASWYGRDFQGRPTSSGETFDMNRISAAHRTLPLPSWVEVTNLTNGRRLIVRINDRGPFHEPDRRIIDLSYAAAVRLGIDRAGTASVRVRAIEPWQYRSREQDR
jgi:rare lipoprotein A